MRWLPVLSLVVLVACSKKPEGGARIADVETAFAKEGWKLDGFRAVDPLKFSAQRCQAGDLDGLDAVVCEYGSDAAVLEGKRAAETWVAQATTGVALGNGRTVLGLADRARTDPNGKQIHKITKAYLAIK